MENKTDFDIETFDAWTSTLREGWNRLDSVLFYLNENGKERYRAYRTLLDLAAFCNSAVEMLEMLEKKDDMSLGDRELLESSQLVLPLRKLHRLAELEQGRVKPVVRCETSMNGHKFIEGNAVGLFGREDYWKDSQGMELHAVKLWGEAGMMFTLPLDMEWVQLRTTLNVLEAIRNVGTRLALSNKLPKGCAIILMDRECDGGYDMGFFFPKSLCCELPEFASHIHEFSDDVFAMFSEGTESVKNP
jgi:hypothetical protein